MKSETKRYQNNAKIIQRRNGQSNGKYPIYMNIMQSIKDFMTISARISNKRSIKHL